MRRWSRRLAGAATIVAAPVWAEAPAPFVDAAKVVPGLVVDMRYCGHDNFVGRPVAGYEAPRCLLTPEAATALARAQAVLAPDGLRLKALDCYRPARAVADFMAWTRDRADTRTKATHYPDVAKADLVRLGYIAARSGHSRGSTVDVTLVDKAGRERAMGTPFDFFGPAAAFAARGTAAPHRADRRRLRRAMLRAGFVPYAQEWWHFTLAHAPHPTTHFDRPVR